MKQLVARLRADESVGQAIRFGVVGVATNLVGFLLYLAVTALGGTPKATMSVLYLAGAAAGFWGNRRLTFAYSGSPWRARLRYVLAHAGGYLINFATLALLVDRMGWAHQLAQAIAIVIVASYLFLALKLWVFRRTPAAREGV